jgi:hypothetical protein
VFASDKGLLFYLLPSPESEATVFTEAPGLALAAETPAVEAVE